MQMVLALLLVRHNRCLLKYKIKLDQEKEQDKKVHFVFGQSFFDHLVDHQISDLTYLAS